jgi:hypothetical protein
MLSVDNTAKVFPLVWLLVRSGSFIFLVILIFLETPLDNGILGVAVELSVSDKDDDKEEDDDKDDDGNDVEVAEEEEDSFFVSTTKL